MVSRVSPQASIWSDVSDSPSERCFCSAHVSAAYTEAEAECTRAGGRQLTEIDVDVAVVGAGPAGATTARELAMAGLRVALIERAKLPRYKSCAGGIPVRTAAMLPFSLDSVIEDHVRGLNVSYKGRSCFTRWADRPFAYMVMRDRFDNLLTDEAVRSGAQLLADSPVREVTRAGDRFELRAGATVVSSRFVVGADGTNSVVARATGLGHGMAESAALEAEVCADRASLDRWRGIANVDFGYQPWGYGWVFPKEHRLSVGLVLPRNSGAALRPHLRTYLDRLGLASAEIERVVGHKLLLRRGNEPIAGNGVLLAGDAAGLADEFTEEGIYYAIRSGAIAAAAITRCMKTGGERLDAYERVIDREIMPELRAARTIARMFYRVLRLSPALMMRLSRHVGYFWNAFFRVQQGASSYDDELNHAWWLRPLLPLVNRAGND